MNSKLINIQNLLTNNDIDAILLYSPQNRYWYSSFASSLGYLLITKKNAYLILDGRYITAARTSSEIDKNIELMHMQGNVLEMINNLLSKNNVNKLGFESDWVTYNQYESFQATFKNQKLISINTDEVRMIKNEWEIQQIQKACDITKQVFDAICQWVKPGVTEKELHRFADDQFLKFGASKTSFDTIIASGENGSKPHATPSDKIIKEGELITIDMGCYYNGYCSDQTRTIAIGDIDPKLQKIYDTVYAAQNLGISLVKPGVEAGFIHNQVKQFITESGYGQYFDHGLGHGLGIEIHEKPYLSGSTRTKLESGMTITIEPGIYIPGLGGVRIEDDLVVTKKGYRMLTSATRELITIKYETKVQDTKREKLKVKRSDLKPRIESSIVMIGIFVVYLILATLHVEFKDHNDAVWLTTGILANIFLAAMVGYFIYELTHAFKILNNYSTRKQIWDFIGFCTLGILFFFTPIGTNWLLSTLMIYSHKNIGLDVFKEWYVQLLLSIGFLTILIFSLFKLNPNNKKINMMYMILFLIVIFGMKGFTNVSLSQLFGVTTTVFVWLIVILNDTLAYLIGTRYGKHKLAPSISPKKSVEGAVGAFIITVVIMIGFALGLYFGINEKYIPFHGIIKLNNILNTVLLYIALTMLLSILTQAGDLLFSTFKRELEIKDFSNLIPGHGGALDRFDSFLLVFTMVYFITLI